MGPGPGPNGPIWARALRYGRELFSKNASLIQVDVDPSQLNRIYKIDQGIVFNVCPVLEKISVSLNKKETWFNRKPKK